MIEAEEEPTHASCADQAHHGGQKHLSEHGGTSSKSLEDPSLIIPPPRQLTRSRSLALKNFDKWQSTPCYNQTVFRFLPMKLPFDGEAKPRHDMKTILENWPDVRMVVDLQNQDDKYASELYGVDHVRVRLESKAFPSAEEIRGFFDVVSDFLENNEQGLVAVHCHYGYNRTGFQVCSYLIEHQNYSVEEAIEAFAVARPPGIRHAHYREELKRRYGGNKQIPSTGVEAETSPSAALRATSAEINL